MVAVATATFAVAPFGTRWPLATAMPIAASTTLFGAIRAIWAIGTPCPFCTSRARSLLGLFSLFDTLLALALPRAFALLPAFLAAATARTMASSFFLLFVIVKVEAALRIAGFLAIRGRPSSAAGPLLPSRGRIISARAVASGVLSSRVVAVLAVASFVSRNGGANFAEGRLGRGGRWRCRRLARWR